MNLIFARFKKTQKTWIQFFGSLKKLKRHEFNFFKLKQAQKTRI